ncbi:RDD family protein [Rarobacter incanus]|uniref:RDD family protein n=1 Tax=Rarobacter incanus TaxID=153494 RepID=A0A542SQV8_9MICO|nr:RDD family protein [Rarobacter incanus]TQK77009.1 RDD family protein [Rarobacter incanus]
MRGVPPANQAPGAVRAIASAIDAGVAACVAAACLSLPVRGLGTVVAVAVGAGYAVLLGVAGWSPGRALMRLRLVDSHTGMPVGAFRASGRTILLVVAPWVMVSALRDPDGIGWHDRMLACVTIVASNATRHRFPNEAAAPPTARAPICADPRSGDSNLAPPGEGACAADALAPGTKAPAQYRPPCEFSEQSGPPPAPVIRGSDVDHFEVAAGATVVASPHGRETPTWELRSAAGESIVVAGPTIVGRCPRAAPGAHNTVRLHDPERSVSRNHVLLLPGRRGLWACDIGSTNGTRIHRKGGETVPCMQSVRVKVDPHDVVEIGDHMFRLHRAISREQHHVDQ